MTSRHRWLAALSFMFFSPLLIKGMDSPNPCPSSAIVITSIVSTN
jgi:hypothetical protein